MDAVLNYFMLNWATLLILIAFAIVLRVTVFLDKTAKTRMYVLISMVLLLSVVVFIEFYLADKNIYLDVRTVFMAIRYSATPLIIAMILHALVKRSRWWVFMPALALAVVNFISIPTGIVFSLNEAGNLIRGPLGYLPYIAVALYSAVLIVLLLLQCNKQAAEIIPIIFLGFALLSGLVLPFIFKEDYSKIFAVTIAVALFVYYVFEILQLTKKDALTGLLNRQAYYAYIKEYDKEITAFITIDMNGLKTINDTGGHDAGDIALTTLGYCFFTAANYKQFVYRIGGDEFAIVCRKTTKEELERLIQRINDNVAKTRYTCSIGYSLNEDGSKTIDQMIKESDEMMYQDKADYYARNNLNRRRQ